MIATEMTKHLRSRLKHEGIKARVRKFEACGVMNIQVFTVEHGKKWTDHERRMIAHIADCNKLTGTRGSKIDPDHEAELSGKELFNFEFHGG